MLVSKSKVITASGSIVGRSCTVSAVTAIPAGGDLIVKLRDGGASGTVRWEFEVDAAAGSEHCGFSPPLYFGTDLYIEIAGTVVNASVSVALVEDQAATDI
ncbi:MAG: hypothetical protein A2Y53_03735 [Chloroflexi bacterium RBG_16_47_49]|nr:MAG: hypothetical protein A2Y53_03735 [Chloroflexi bacterium RBG_16_47_49]